MGGFKNSQNEYQGGTKKKIFCNIQGEGKLLFKASESESSLQKFG